MINRFIIKPFKNFLEKLVIKERSPRILALSFCFGVYIAFCPFVGFHTIMVIGLSWLLSLNFAVTLASSIFVNNPWTMFPIYSIDYFFGVWIFKALGIDLAGSNPQWMNSLNQILFKYTGISGISFWAFMVGGNLLGLLISVILYPVVKRAFERIASKSVST